MTTPPTPAASSASTPGAASGTAATAPPLPGQQSPPATPGQPPATAAYAASAQPSAESTPGSPPPSGPVPRRWAQIASPLVLLGALAQLAALGLVGPVVFSALIGLGSVGVALVPLLGIGLVLLLGVVYSLYALGWAETARVQGLYGLAVPSLRPRARTKPGFAGFATVVWHQFIDAAMWRAIANVAISTILGLVVLPLIALVASAVALAFAPLYSRGVAPELWDLGVNIDTRWAPVVGAVTAVAAVAVLAGIALLHGIITRAIVEPSPEAQLRAQAETSDAQRAGAIRASALERTRLERDLHDGVQPRLVSVGMTLGLAQQKIDSDPTKAKELIEEAHTSTKAAITELRQLARGIHASVLDDRGLDAALSALAGRSHVPVSLDVRMTGRCSRDAEAAVYFAIAESITNAAKHSRASECRVTVRVRDEGMLWARVEDNGVGGARIIAGGGLDGISNRVLAAGGTVRLDSPAGGPTSLEVSVPCAS